MKYLLLRQSHVSDVTVRQLPRDNYQESAAYKSRRVISALFFFLK